MTDECPSASNESAEIRALDYFCAEQKVNYIDLLKVDTEGLDLEVLKGAEAMLRSHKIPILAEVSFDPDNTYHTSFFRLAEYLHDVGISFC